MTGSPKSRSSAPPTLRTAHSSFSTSRLLIRRWKRCQAARKLDTAHALLSCGHRVHRCAAETPLLPMLQGVSSPFLRARGPTLQATRDPLPGCMVSALSYARVARREPPLIECSGPPDTGGLKQHLLRAPLDGARRVPARVRSQPFSRERGASPRPALILTCRRASTQVPVRGARAPLETFLPERTIPPPSTRGASAPFLPTRRGGSPCFLGTWRNTPLLALAGPPGWVSFRAQEGLPSRDPVPLLPIKGGPTGWLRGLHWAWRGSQLRTEWSPLADSTPSTGHRGVPSLWY